MDLPHCPGPNNLLATLHSNEHAPKLVIGLGVFQQSFSPKSIVMFRTSRINVHSHMKARIHITTAGGEALNVVFKKTIIKHRTCRRGSAPREQVPGKYLGAVKAFRKQCI